MIKKLTVKEILECKGNKKLTEVYTHNPLEAESCELAEVEMIVSSENNDIEGIRNAAKNTFFTVGLQYGKYLSELDILKSRIEKLEQNQAQIDSSSTKDFKNSTFFEEWSKKFLKYLLNE